MTGPAGPEPTGPEPTGPEPTGPGPARPGRPGPGDDPQERDPSLARARTSLAWTRTAISFAALGGVVLKENVFSGLVILAIAAAVWQLGRVARGSGPRADPPAAGATRLFMIAVSIVAVALLCLAVAIFGETAPGALR
jgi:uncharacterized membrane protein YidH (DUF202 family)